LGAVVDEEVNVSDRDGDYAAEMARARGDYAANQRETRWNSQINPLGKYQQGEH